MITNFKVEYKHIYTWMWILRFTAYTTNTLNNQCGLVLYTPLFWKHQLRYA